MGGSHRRRFFLIKEAFFLKLSFVLPVSVCEREWLSRKMICEELNISWFEFEQLAPHDIAMAAGLIKAKSRAHKKTSVKRFI